MKIELNNQNYCASIIKIKNIIILENCDNIVHTKIFGNSVLISKDVKVDDIGIYFPIETCLSREFLSNNNLYRDKTLNIDQNKAGFFELSGRVKCMKMRGSKSEGLWIPIESLSYLNVDLSTLKEGSEFNVIDQHEICKKYQVEKKTPNNLTKKDRTENRKTRFNKIINNQFRFHFDTAQLAKNLHRFEIDTIISISEKLHGCAHTSGNILCNKKLSIKDKIAKFLGVNIITTEYDNIYSSRKVIKNQYIYETENKSYYPDDIWKEANNDLKHRISKGLTIYGEIVGYLPSGGGIQGKYDYGCKPKEHQVYVYRITHTDVEGNVFEYSSLQVRDFCLINKIKSVPIHYHGTVEKFLIQNKIDICIGWRDKFVDTLIELYLEKNCSICKNKKMPNEGIVVRIEGLDIQAYKLKSFRFNLKESKNLDKGVVDLEAEENI